jgi:D-glycero-alpha-D-manno-heptose-7-phosphate kinase
MKLIIAKTPLRLTLGGGGTDLPNYASKYGGFVVTSALDRYIYVLVKDRFEREIRASYSITEICKSIEEIKHPVIREALKLLGLKDHLEIVSSADMPSETGLGSSGSFTVGLLNALHSFKDERLSRSNLAEEATNLVMNILKEPCGCQDTHIASFGGFQCLDISTDGNVKVTPLDIKYDVIRELENNLLFFYTGIKRSANNVLKDQAKHIEENIEDMHKIKRIGYEVKKALENGDLRKFGELQHDHWMAKKRTSTEISDEKITKWYLEGLKNGAIGGKIVGAGGGGFLMFYCENRKDNLRKTMVKYGLEEVRFQFEEGGSKVVIDI